jgi:hypothetical protein
MQENKKEDDDKSQLKPQVDLKTAEFIVAITGSFLPPDKNKEKDKDKE